MTTSGKKRTLPAITALAAGPLLLSGVLAGALTTSVAPSAQAATRPSAPEKGTTSKRHVVTIVVPKAIVAKPHPKADPTLTIRVGGDRTVLNGPPGPPAVSPLAGVTFGIAPASGDNPTTCVSTAAGLCTFHVDPNRTYTVTRTGTPAGWFGSNSTPAARSGTWALSRVDPALPEGCGLRIAVLFDLSSSITPQLLPTYQAAGRAFVHALRGTPSSVGIYTFGTTAPAANTSGTNNANLVPPVSVATPAGVSTLTNKINGLNVPSGSYTNWDGGIWQIAQDDALYHYQAAVVLTDGDPTRYGPNNNLGGVVNPVTTRFAETENGIFSANALKAQHTTVLGVGIGTSPGGLEHIENLRAISGRTENVNYFSTDFAQLGTVLKNLALRNCAGIDVTKTASPATYDHVGQQITYRYTVRNTKFFTLHGVHVTDDRIAGPIPCTPSTLATGEMASCTASYTVTQADLDRGRITNAATATGNTPNDDDVTAPPVEDTVTGRQHPAIQVVKTAFPTEYAEPGEEITYTYTVTNTGDVTLHAITVQDDLLGAAACPSLALPPGASLTCLARHVTTEDDVAAGQIANTATATGRPETGAPVTDSNTDEIHANSQPAIQLDKAAFPTRFAEPGERISYTYTVTNTGNVPLTMISLHDDRLGAIACPRATLSPAESMTCHGRHVTTQADVDAGSVANTASVIGYPPAGAAAADEDQAEARADHAPGIALDKSASPAVFGAGQRVRYTYLVTNTGKTTVRDVAVHDDRLGAIACPDTTLAPGESMTCHATHIATEGDAANGEIANTATVTGFPPSGPAVSAGDAEIISAGRISLVKSAFPTAYGAPGETITYTYTVTNTGRVPLGHIRVTDDRIGGPVACLRTTLEPGESTTCTAPHVASEADVTAGHIANAATVTADPPSGPPVSDEDTATIRARHLPGIQLLKAASPVTFDRAAQPVGFTYTVTDTGNVPLHGLALVDDKVGVVTCQATRLAPGESTTCHAAYATTPSDVLAGYATNVAAVTGYSPAGLPVIGRAAASITLTDLPEVPVTG
jgi:hypothetical protein